MPTLFTIDGAVEQGQLVRDAICANHGYDGDPADNPAKNAFARAWIMAKLKAEVRKYKGDMAGAESAALYTARYEEAQTETDGMDVL